MHVFSDIVDISPDVKRSTVNFLNGTLFCLLLATYLSDEKLNLCIFVSWHWISIFSLEGFTVVNGLVPFQGFDILFSKCWILSHYWLQCCLFIFNSCLSSSCESPILLLCHITLSVICFTGLTQNNTAVLCSVTWIIYDLVYVWGILNWV